ncbi:MAG: hypothetical protein KGO93_03855 [Cyanobacteria bacterium REEB446]|nr:hypothetical protein [Cyanobacteria bacterium REEB446]
MVLGLLKNLPILNSFLAKPASTKESLETEASAKANEKAIAQEGLKPLFIVVLPAEGDFSELKAKLKEKFNGRDLRFELDPELKKPKLYILKPNALAKRNLEIALDKAFIKNNYKSIELSGDANKLGESLVKTMSSELISLKGAERKIEYAQKEAEKANSRQTLEKLSQMGVHVCSAECEEHKQILSEKQIKSVRDALSGASNSKPKTSVNPSRNTTQVQAGQKRKEDLKAFFTKSQKFEDNHLDHNELIQASNSIYLIRNHNPDKNIDLAKIELTFAHRDNTTDNFTIRRLPLMDFLDGLELPASSEEINNKNFHSNEFHKKIDPQSSLSLLDAIEQKNSSQVETAIQESKKKEEEQLKSQIEQQLKSIARQIRTYIKKTEQKSVTPLIKLNSFSTGLQQQVEEFRVKNLATNIKNLFQVISSPTNQEQFKNLDGKIAQEYRDTRIRIAKELDVDELLGASITDKDSPEAKTEKESILGQLEQSDPISQKINRELAQRDDFKNSKDPKTGKEEHDKQVGGIALTGQLSFIDRKDFHERNQTYKDFPELPESWKTEPDSPKTTTQETQTNHNPVSNTPQTTAQEPTKTSTETINHHTEAATSHPSELVNPAAEENLDRENKTQL